MDMILGFLKRITFLVLIIPAMFLDLPMWLLTGDAWAVTNKLENWCDY